MSIKKLQKILAEIDLPVMMEIVEHIWCREYEHVKWNLDNDKTELEEGDGETYSVEVRGSSEKYDGYLVVNGDNGCGETITYFFNLSKEVKF